jgi:hypothetical protein
MSRWLWPVRRSGPPRFPMTIAGHGQIHHAQLSPRSQRRLARLAGAHPQHWGLLFVLDARQHRWVLYSPDAEYTALFAPAAHTLDLDPDVFTSKFPIWSFGWELP